MLPRTDGFLLMPSIISAAALSGAVSVGGDPGACQWQRQGTTLQRGQSIPCTAWGWRWFAPGCCQPRLWLLAGEEEVGAGEPPQNAPKGHGTVPSHPKMGRRQLKKQGANHPPVRGGGPEAGPRVDPRALDPWWSQEQGCGCCKAPGPRFPSWLLQARGFNLITCFICANLFSNQSCSARRKEASMGSFEPSCSRGEAGHLSLPGAPAGRTSRCSCAGLPCLM